MSLKDFLKAPTVGHYRDQQRALRTGQPVQPRLPVFAGVRVADGAITYEGRTYPLPGARVEVDTAGGFRTRLSATRIALTGVVGLFARKTVDYRELYLLITTAAGELVVKVDAKLGPQARQFAADINNLAGHDTA